jgi:cell division protein FtsI/penicillin-binding protein 2
MWKDRSRPMGKWKPPPGNAHIQFRKRLAVLEGTILFIVLLIIAQLVNLQILQHQKYAAKADNIQFVSKEIPAQRGTIYDRNGKILALDISVKTVYADTKNIVDIDHTIHVLSKTLQIPAEKIRAKLKEPYPRIKRKVTIEEYDKLIDAKLKGLVFEDDFQRIYPKGILGSHVIGCVNVDGEGIEGAELQYNKILAGKKGIIKWLRDGRGNYLSSLGKTLSLSEQGKDIYLTIDEHIQHIVEEEAEKGWKDFSPHQISIIVMDPISGEILALVNKPAYNPNNPGAYSAEHRRNYAVTDLFEPGSIFKIVTAAAALEEKKVRINEPIHCEGGRWFVRNHYLHDTHSYGTLTFDQVIIKSSNIGTVKVAMRLGEEKFYDHVSRFGFGKKTGIDLPGEIQGIFRPLHQWSGYSITAIPIGQEVGVTCLQATRTMAVLANGGYLVTPHILKDIKTTEKIARQEPQKIGPILSLETLEVLNKTLARVVSEEGTATRAQIKGYKICGKTGTSQKFVGGRFSHSLFVGSFIGFLPLEKPRAVILVKVDEPKGAYYGGVVAAPLFREIAWRMMQYWDIPPEPNDKTIAMKLP